MTSISIFALPFAVTFIVGYGMVRGVRVFDVFLDGAKEGLQTAIRVLPALIGLITAVGMFQASGGLDLITFALGPLGRLIGLPDPVLPLALLRPVSGSGALVLFEDILSRFGPDSLPGRVASVIEGASETTFYTVAVYYGAAKIRNARHTIPASLCADVAGFVFAALAVTLFFYS